MLEEPESHAYKMTVQEFMQNSFMFTPDDGIGFYGTNTEESKIVCWDFTDEKFTHIYWYNK